MRMCRSTRVCGLSPELSDRVDPLLRGRCAQRLAAAASSDDPAARAAAVQDPQCPPGWRQRLRADPVAFVRWAQPASGAARTAATDPNDGVRLAAVRGGGCGPRVLARLAQDPDKEIRQAAAADPNCSPLVLWRLAACDPESEVRAAAETVSLRRWHRTRTVRLAFSSGSPGRDFVWIW